MTLAQLVPLVVVGPLVAAGLTLAAAHHTRVQRAVSLLVTAGVVVFAALMLRQVDTAGPLVVPVGSWLPTEGVALVVDRLSALMLLVSSAVTLFVLLYAMGEGDSAWDMELDGQAPLPVFHPSMLVLLAGVATTFISGDLFHIYVGFEILLGASFVLLTLGGTHSRVRAGVTYALVSILASTVFLLALALIYAAVGTVNLAQLSQRLGEIPEGTRTLLQVMLLVGFAIKAAVFPMSGWLPDSYPTAPAPVTAVFAGLLTKVGVYALIRTQTLMFGSSSPDVSAPLSRVNEVLLVAAILTMVVGILGAVAQSDMRRMLSFTLVSHIGFMLMGLALGTVDGLSAAIFYATHHIVIQTTLFLVLGLIQRQTGTVSIALLGSLARTVPLLAVLFLVPALNLVGVPPFSGFLGKVGLLQAAVEQGSTLAWAALVAALVTSLLTLYAVVRVWAKAFWAEPHELSREERRALRPVLGERRITPGVVLPTSALLGVSLGLSVVGGPLFGYTDRAADALISRTEYIQAVQDAADRMTERNAPAIHEYEQGGH